MVSPVYDDIVSIADHFCGQGFSLLMFGGTIHVLWSRQSTHRVNRSMLTVACLLLLISTVVRVSLGKYGIEIDSLGAT